MKEVLKFFERCQCLRWIDRCSNTPHIKTYSVAQHSFYTALYAMTFAYMENERLGYLAYNVPSIIQRAIIHDLEESVTGDILYPLWNRNPKFKEKLDSIRNECVDKEVFAELPDETKRFYKLLWETAKDSSLEGIMISCMDKFEIVLYAMSELELGNKAVVGLFRNAIRLIKAEFEIPSVLSVIKDIERTYIEISRDNL